LRNQQGILTGKVQTKSSLRITGVAGNVTRYVARGRILQEYSAEKRSGRGGGVEGSKEELISTKQSDGGLTEMDNDTTCGIGIPIRTSGQFIKYDNQFAIRVRF
jgi:hypothetical protein